MLPCPNLEIDPFSLTRSNNIFIISHREQPSQDLPRRSARRIVGTPQGPTVSFRKAVVPIETWRTKDFGRNGETHNGPVECGKFFVSSRFAAIEKEQIRDGKMPSLQVDLRHSLREEVANGFVPKSLIYCEELSKNGSGGWDRDDRRFRRAFAWYHCVQLLARLVTLLARFALP